MQHPALEAWNFIGQALADHANTLQPASRAAFQEVANRHANELLPVINAGIAANHEVSEKGDPQKPSKRGGDSQKKPA